MRPAGVFSAIPRRSPTLPASRAADPHPVAGADGRPRHRPLCLCAGAAGYARHAGLVVFRGRFHEHDQRGRLSRGRPARLAHDRAIRAGGLGALGDAGLRAVAGAVRHVGQFLRPEFRPAAGGRRRCGRIRRRRRAGGDDCAVAARTGEFPAQPVLCRPRHRHPVVGTGGAVRPAVVRPGFVVDRLVGDDGAGDHHDDPRPARAAPCRRHDRRRRQRRNSRSRRS